MIVAFIEHVPFAVFSVAAVTGLGIIIGYWPSLWISEKVADFLGGVPTTKFNRPLPLIGRGVALAMKGQLTEAAALYESYLDEHPENLDLYYHLIDLAFGPLDDPAFGHAIICRGDEHLPERDCQGLRHHRDAILSGEYHPLKHLGWRSDLEKDHPAVAIPDALKGQFSSPPQI